MSNPIKPDRLVIASILNWNTAEMTTRCVERLRTLSVPDGVRFDILVVDNGSRPDDLELLRTSLRGFESNAVVLHGEPKNLGFAGGTNVALRIATKREAGFIWLVNSDAEVDQSDTLAVLLAHMDTVSRCGAASPQLKLLAPPHKTYFSGAYHDWERRISVRMDALQSRRESLRRPLDMWVPGTALFLRMSALQETGGLDERFFAYYEDDEICTRLARHGWTSDICYDIAIKHEMPRAETDRPPYYFYLIQRNHLLFWYANTPKQYRRFLLLKLLDQAFFDVNKLSRKGHTDRAKASALGLYDFLTRRFGAPDLKRDVPWTIRQLVRLFALIQRKALDAHMAALPKPR